MKDPLKVERYADNGELSHYEIINSKTGEIYWYSGKPEVSGRYLVIYNCGDIRKPLIADYDEIEDKWLSLLDSIIIEWWREIPPYFL
jgi:hypothetical protein